MSDVGKAKQLQVHRKCDHPSMQTNGIWAEVSSRRAANHIQVRKATKIKRFLDVLILDLWVAATYEDVPWRGVSLRSLDYSKDTRYQKLFLTAKLFIPLLKDLIALDYVDEWYGSQTSGLRTRIKATDKLLDLCTDWEIAHVFRATDVPEEEIIRLKSEKDRDGKTKLLEYEDTRQTNKMRKMLRLINQKLDEAVITIPGVKADTSDKRLHRVFNNGLWTQGGRFYGGFWIGLKQRELSQRELILIDGQPCCELDFKATHATMAYNLHGLPAPEDSYVIPGIDRPTVKKAFVVLFNTKSRKETINAMIKEKHIVDSEGVLAAIEAAHPVIAPKFHKGQFGMELQNMDSRIAAAVLDDMYQQNIVCLPIHDSFIVQRQHEAALRIAMVSSWTNLLGQEPKIDKKY